MAKPERKPAPNAPKAAQRPSRFKEYFYANILFWLFLAVVMGLVWNSCQDPNDDEAIKFVLGDTFKFVFLLFGLGFTLVTLFDAAYDFFAKQAENSELEEKQSVPRS